MKKKNTKAPVFKALRVILATAFVTALILAFAHIEFVFDKFLYNIPKLEFWPAVLAGNVVVLAVIVLLTLLLGRVYCSVMCPVGVYQDAVYKLTTIGARKKSHRLGYTKPLNWLRYGVLAVFIVLVAVGLEAFAYLLEPYSIFGRAVSSLASKSLTIAAVSCLTVLAITLLAVRKGRIWCNTMCPVGSILGLVSRWSIMRPKIDEQACIGCGSCAKACRASCIDPVGHTVDMSRCVLCFDCLSDCKVGAIDYKPVLTFGGPAKDEPKADSKAEAKADAAKTQTDSEAKTQEEAPSRRAFIAAGALTFGSLLKSRAQAQGSLAVLRPKQTPVRRTPVVPAGANSVKNFDSKCVACQLCVTACPNKVLRPDTDGKTGLFLQPVMGFDQGFCRPECTACSQACPAGAITPVTPEQKASISIGHAEVDLRLCVVNTDEVSCGNCARHCPAGAIRMVAQKAADGSDTGRKVPAVITERCIGCGRCEYVCPSRPVSAIYVEGNEVHHTI